MAAEARRDAAAARKLYVRALGRLRPGGDGLEAAIIHNNLGLLDLRAEGGDLGRAQRHLQEALRLRRLLGDARGLAETLGNLGVLAQVQGDLPQAARHHAEALEQEKALGHTFGIGRALCNLGEAALEGDDAARACRLLAAAERMLHEVRSDFAPYAADLLARAAAAAAQSPDSLRCEARALTADDLLDWATAD
jgi:hypothetical protein